MIKTAHPPHSLPLPGVDLEEQRSNLQNIRFRVPLDLVGYLRRLSYYVRWFLLVSQLALLDQVARVDRYIN